MEQQLESYTSVDISAGLAQGDPDALVLELKLKVRIVPLQGGGGYLEQQVDKAAKHCGDACAKSNDCCFVHRWDA